MKKSLVILSLMVLSLTLVGFISAETCDLKASLVNQDPYPAVQGDYVKLLFQLNGVAESGCGVIEFTLLEKYPISFDAGTENIFSVNSGTFTKDHPSFLMIPYKIRVDENSIDGANPVEVSFTNNAGTPLSVSYLDQFNIEVKDVRVKFEVLVKDYNINTKILTLEVLNIGDADVQALTLEIPNKGNGGVLNVKGANTNILGDIDSNEYTTSDFEITPISPGELFLNIKYTDETGTRRETSEKVYFDAKTFNGKKADQKSPSWGLYIFVIIVLGVVGYIFYRRYQKKKKKEMHHMIHH